ncbi:hypothetical protein L6164_011122 [Bauhinia variegata]|uniref:Uncharacterized protein n=1 Tax=Bauhinia variegata TaxID=167791 RepID=A0ACB9P5L8_BAUVA|nr:hypothetical protein L6164_011122 [Bauhinia variegata]
MSEGSSPPPPISGERSSPEPNCQNHVTDSQNETPTAKEETTSAPAPAPPTTRSNRPSRACTIRAASRLYSTAQPAIERKPKAAKKEQRQDESPQQQQCSKIVTPLVEPPPPAQLPRWNLRSMWELASVLNFLHVFMPLLNISVEFSAEEFETALLTPNDTLSDIHMPLLKAIPPITRMALTRDTWITVLCRKLRDWWHWVADGDIPIVASHGAEIEVYKSLDPGVRVVILKALCDIRVEQEDIRSYIDHSLKHGVQFSTFRKERIGGDSQGISYWYEDDPIIGHRLYREIRKTEVKEVKKGKTKGSQVLPRTTYQWEAVATNFDEFQDVSEKLFSSKNRTEASLGKKLKNDMLPEIEKVHKRKERLLKKQHRQALLLDNFLVVDGLAPGRSLRDRKPVTYTFDDYDRSINEAIKITKKKQPSPEPMPSREVVAKPEGLPNGKWNGSPHAPQHISFHMSSPKSPDYDDEEEEDHKDEELDRSNRRRQRPQRYSEKEFVEALSDNEADFDSDDDIVGEAIYDEEYLRKRKQRKKLSSSSEGDEEYQWDEENGEEEEEEYDDEDSLSISEDSVEPRKVKKLPGRTRRETKLRSVDEIQSGLRRSKRASRNRINYRQYEMSESETESMKPEKSNATDDHSEASENGEYMMDSEDTDNGNDDHDEMEVENPVAYPEVKEKEKQPPEKSSSPPGQDEVEGMGKRRFLDLNELAPSSGFDDGPNTIMKDEDKNDY